jgi:glycosyltransferase involved in cell wall biosynthesis
LDVKLALDVSAVPPKVAGAGRYIVELARRLPDRGVTTTLVTRRDDVSRWETLSPRATGAALVPRARVARLVSEAYLLGESRIARESDLWHAPHYTMPRRRATPCVVTIHDLTFFTNPEWHERSKVAFFRRAINYSAAHARVLLSVSAYSARLLDEILPDHAPVVVAPLGVELDTFNQNSADDASLFERHGLSLNVPYIFFVGTMEPRKGLDVLLDAFVDLAGEIDDVELWLAGQSGWGVGPIESKIAAHPYAARIRRLGFVADDVLPALYRQARVVAYPSRGEGFGLPVLEAMACGAIVVTSADTVMAEVAGDDAVVAPIGDATALAARLRDSLYAGDDERTTRARNARARAERFTWDACLDQHLVAYEMALG